jgi:deoxyribose-phosphate aldolase
MEKSDQDWAGVVKKVLQELDKPREAAHPSNQSSVKTNSKTVAQYIDHTLLKTDATGPQIDQICEEALKYNFAVSLSST